MSLAYSTACGCTCDITSWQAATSTAHAHDRRQHRRSRHQHISVNSSAVNQSIVQAKYTCETKNSDSDLNVHVDHVADARTTLTITECELAFCRIYLYGRDYVKGFNV